MPMPTQGEPMPMSDQAGEKSSGEKSSGETPSPKTLANAQQKMLEELKQMFESGGFLEGSHNTPGHFVIEKAFVER
jgi:hypothetical protein